MSAFHARILASDALFFDGDCEFIVVPCTDGAMGILSHHSNMIAAVVPGELRCQPVDGPLRTAPRRRPFCKRKVCRSTGTRRLSWPGPSAACGPKNTGTADAEP